MKKQPVIKQVVIYQTKTGALELKTDFYLPISAQIVYRIINGDANNLEKIIFSLNTAQIAALLLLQNLPQIKSKRSIHPERCLAETISVLNSRVERDGLSSMKTELVLVFNFKDIEEGYQMLPFFRIVLLDEEAIRAQDYLTPAAKWDYTFQERYSEKLLQSLVSVTNDRTGKNQTLTAEQSRIYREIKAQADDHLHVQGYAGTGKSSLVRNLIAMLTSKESRIIILAERQTQIQALKSGIGHIDRVFAKTFAH